MCSYVGVASACLFSEVLLYGHKTSLGMRFVRCEVQVVRISEVEMYRKYATIAWGQAFCPFYGGCALIIVSVIGGSIDT